MKEQVIEIPLRPKSDDEFLHAAWMMEKGGRFSGAIGEAYIAADPQNRARLRAAFPDLFTTFFREYRRLQNE